MEITVPVPFRWAELIPAGVLLSSARFRFRPIQHYSTTISYLYNL